MHIYRNTWEKTKEYKAEATVVWLFLVIGISLQFLKIYSILLTIAYFPFSSHSQCHTSSQTLEIADLCHSISFNFLNK
jgi:hypothetical protein